MLQLLIAMLTSISVVAFAMSNMHHVELSFIVGAPLQVRLTFLLAAAFVSGFMAAVLNGMIRRARLDAARRKQLLRHRRAALTRSEVG